MEEIKIYQMKDANGNPVAPKSPEKAIFDENGIRLDIKLKGLNLEQIKDAQNSAIDLINETKDTSLQEINNATNGIYTNTGVNEYEEFSESKPYDIGDVVKKDGLLYKFTSVHIAGPWTGKDVEPTSIKNETDNKLIELENQIENITSIIEHPSIEWDGYFIADNGEKSNLIAGQAKSLFFKVEPNTKLLIELGKVYGSSSKNYYHYAFYNSLTPGSNSIMPDYSLLRVFDKTFKGEVVVPQGAELIGISIQTSIESYNNISLDTSLEGQIIEINNDIVNIFTNVFDTLASSNLLLGLSKGVLLNCFLENDNKFIVNNNVSSILFPIKQGDKVFMKKGIQPLVFAILNKYITFKKDEIAPYANGTERITSNEDVFYEVTASDAKYLLVSYNIGSIVYCPKELIINGVSYNNNGITYSYNKQAFIDNKKCTFKNYQYGVETALYNSLECLNNVKKIMVKAVWDYSNEQYPVNVALIANPNGIYNIQGQTTNIRKKSIHIVFGKDRVYVQLMNNGLINKHEILYEAIKTDGSTEYTFGWELVIGGIKIYTPDGMYYEFTDEEDEVIYKEYTGKYACLEFYTSSLEVNYSPVNITRIDITDENNFVVYDDFNRPNNLLIQTPSGFKWCQQSTIEGYL